MKKNTIKAVAYVIGGMTGISMTFLAMLNMYFSSTFLPIYVKGTYVLGNQVLRYEIYAVLLVIGLLSVVLTDYGMNYLNKKSRKNRRRR